MDICVAATLALHPDRYAAAAVNGHAVEEVQAATPSVFHREAAIARSLATALRQERQSRIRRLTRHRNGVSSLDGQTKASHHTKEVAATSMSRRAFDRARKQRQQPADSPSSAGGGGSPHAQAMSFAEDALDVRTVRKHVPAAMFGNASTLRFLKHAEQHGRTTSPAPLAKRKQSSSLSTSKRSRDGSGNSFATLVPTPVRSVRPSSPVLLVNGRHLGSRLPITSRAITFFDALTAIWLQPMSSIPGSEGYVCDAMRTRDLRRSCGVDTSQHVLKALEYGHSSHFARLVRHWQQNPEAVKAEDCNGADVGKSASPCDGSSQTVDGRQCRRNQHPQQQRNSTLTAQDILQSRLQTTFQHQLDLPTFVAPDVALLFKFVAAVPLSVVLQTSQSNNCHFCPNCRYLEHCGQTTSVAEWFESFKRQCRVSARGIQVLVPCDGSLQQYRRSAREPIPKYVLVWWVQIRCSRLGDNVVCLAFRRPEGVGVPEQFECYYGIVADIHDGGTVAIQLETGSQVCFTHHDLRICMWSRNV